MTDLIEECLGKTYLLIDDLQKKRMTAEKEMKSSPSALLSVWPNAR